MFAIGLWETLKRVPWTLIAGLVVVVVIWFSGHHSGASSQKIKDNTRIAALEKQHQGDIDAVTKQLADNRAKELHYELQLRTAASEAAARRAELARLRAAPHPGLVCELAPSSGSVPGAPRTATNQTPADGVFSPPTGRNIGDPLYDLADQADSAVETARAALAQWPE